MAIENKKEFNENNELEQFKCSNNIISSVIMQSIESMTSDYITHCQHADDVIVGLRAKIQNAKDHTKKYTKEKKNYKD